MRKKVFNAVKFLCTIIIIFILFTNYSFAEKKNSCIECHSTLGENQKKIISDWEASVHHKSAYCEECHGGNPREDTFEKAMSKEAGFIGVPGPEKIPDLCARCHSNPQKMRPFNLQIGQLEQYKTSVHGRKLYKDKVKEVATCVSCHGNHKILPHNNPESTVYKTNIPKTCAVCHSDKKLMEKFNLKANQMEEYTESIHGIKLLKDLNMGAPSCADCHGVHGATPPGVKEIVDVCGNCHSQTKTYFEDGSHGKAYAQTGEPRCITCHHLHKISLPSDEMFISKDKGTCSICHSQGDPGYRVAVDFSKMFEKNKTMLNEVEKEIETASELQTYVEEIKGDLDNARTSLIEAKALQHTVAKDRVKEKIDNSIKILEKLDSRIKNILKEHEHRRNLAIILGIFWILACLVIVIRIITLPKE